ncbi:MAG: hypothetical protein AB1489_39500 [Acidobacteriota bacterium]
MKITIHRKSINGPLSADTYNLVQGEFARFSEEFSKYLREGTPRRGHYSYLTEEKRDGIMQRKDLILLFEEISVIE